mmetsp:Transcript_87482/g.155160  ORF Transcript_87482/g.155160 Transcript_87482/m.155160 type:complete len:214 (+) Transcript_87482:281-922(+)
MEAEHAREQLENRSILDVRQALLEALALSLVETGNVMPGLSRLQEVKVVLLRCAEQVKDHIKLISVLANVIHDVCGMSVIWRQWITGCAGEERMAVLFGRMSFAIEEIQQLCEDAASRPSVDSLCVKFLDQDELRGTVPASRYVSCQGPISAPPSDHWLLVFWLFLDALFLCAAFHCCAGHVEIANLHRAVFVHQAICWLEIAMINPNRVDVI